MAISQEPLSKLWMNAKIEALIEGYRQQEALWKSSKAKSANRIDCWKVVSEKTGMPIVECKRKMDSLLASHRREKNKFLNAKENGTTYETRWVYWDQLSFVRDEASKNNRSARSTNYNFFNESNDSPFVNVDPLSPENNISYVEELEEEEDSKIFAEPLEKKRALDLCKTEYEEEYKPPKDNLDLFGRYVASELGSFNERTQIILKQKINNLIYEAKISALENS